MNPRHASISLALVLAAACAYAPDAGDSPADDTGGTSDAGPYAADAHVPPAHEDAAPPPFDDDAGTPQEAGSKDAAAADTGADAGAEGGTWGPAPDVTAVLTADNAYGFGWGDANGLTTYTPVAPATEASQIFACPIGTGPESFTIAGKDAPPNAYFYVVTWADHATTQGFLGKLRSASSLLLTGDARWSVCATGVEYVAPAPGPTQQVVTQQIALCNTGTGSKTTSSAGWVNAAGAVTPDAVGTLAVGEDNSDNGGAFQLVCQSDNGKEGIPAGAHWMWYSPAGGDAFHYSGSGNTTRTFLVFRVPSNAL